MRGKRNRGAKPMRNYRNAFVFALILNVLLAGGLAFVWSRFHPLGAGGAPAPPPAPGAAAPGGGAGAPPAPPPGAAAPGAGGGAGAPPAPSGWKRDHTKARPPASSTFRISANTKALR